MGLKVQIVFQTEVRASGISSAGNLFELDVDRGNVEQQIEWLGILLRDLVASQRRVTFVVQSAAGLERAPLHSDGTSFGVDLDAVDEATLSRQVAAVGQRFGEFVSAAVTALNEGQPSIKEQRRGFTRP